MLVKGLLETEFKKSPDEPVLIEHRKKLTTTDGTVYEIDLFFKLYSSGFEYWNIVECKYWDQFVTRDILNTILHKVNELGVHKAIVVSKKGFQKGAIDLARKYRVALIKVSDDRSLNYILHADGNLDGYFNFLSKETEDELTHESGLIGLAFTGSGIYDFIGDRCGIEIAEFLRSGEIDNYLDIPDTKIPPVIKEQLQKLTPELLKQYQFIETCGLPLKLYNEPELRMINISAFMMKLM